MSARPNATRRALGITVAMLALALLVCVGVALGYSALTSGGVSSAERPRRDPAGPSIPQQEPHDALVERVAPANATGASATGAVLRFSDTHGLVLPAIAVFAVDLDTKRVVRRWVTDEQGKITLSAIPPTAVLVAYHLEYAIKVLDLAEALDSRAAIILTRRPVVVCQIARTPKQAIAGHTFSVATVYPASTSRVLRILRDDIKQDDPSRMIPWDDGLAPISITCPLDEPFDLKVLATPRSISDKHAARVPMLSVDARVERPSSAGLIEVSFGILLPLAYGSGRLRVGFPYPCSCPIRVIVQGPLTPGGRAYRRPAQIVFSADGQSNQDCIVPIPLAPLGFYSCCVEVTGTATYEIGPFELKDACDPFVSGPSQYVETRIAVTSPDLIDGSELLVATPLGHVLMNKLLKKSEPTASLPLPLGQRFLFSVDAPGGEAGIPLTAIEITPQLQQIELARWQALYRIVVRLENQGARSDEGPIWCQVRRVATGEEWVTDAETSGKWTLPGLSEGLYAVTAASGANQGESVVFTVPGETAEVRVW